MHELLMGIDYKLVNNMSMLIQIQLGPMIHHNLKEREKKSYKLFSWQKPFNSRLRIGQSIWLYYSSNRFSKHHKGILHYFLGPLVL